MTLPNGDRAIADIEKLRGYCLNPWHPKGRHKARVFASFGVRGTDAEELRTVLLSAAREQPAVLGVPSPYGRRYVVDFDWVRSGRTIRIRSAWIIIDDVGLPRLTSCYVL